MGHQVTFTTDNPLEEQDRFTELEVTSIPKDILITITGWQEDKTQYITLNKRSAIKLVREIRKHISFLED